MTKPCLCVVAFVLLFSLAQTYILNDSQSLTNLHNLKG